MSKDDKSLSHTRWNCKYHIVFTPKYGMATLFLTKIIRCCECCGVMAPIALDNEHPRI